jgi:hypothetical protein
LVVADTPLSKFRDHPTDFLGRQLLTVTLFPYDLNGVYLTGIQHGARVHNSDVVPTQEEEAAG